MPRAPKVSPHVAARKERLRALIDAFCDARLNAEYRGLCRKLLEAWVKTDPEAIVRGKENVSAAAIVHLIAANNDLFYRMLGPQIAAPEIAEGFGVSVASVYARMRAIRETLDAAEVDAAQFLTKRTRQEEESAYYESLLRETPWGINSTSTPRTTEALFGQILAALGDRSGSPATIDEDGDFVDADREAMSAFHRIMEKVPEERQPEALRKLIELDPDFYDSYLALAELRGDESEDGAREARALYKEACERAVARVAPGGNWPPRIRWGFLENRHILRALLNEALALWEDGATDAAAALFGRMLAVCPDDNAGARHYLLALREGMTFTSFDDAFMGEIGYDARKVWAWFDAGVGKYPDDFAAWQATVTQEE